MSIEETDNIIIGLAKKYGKIKECIDNETEQYFKEMASQSADEVESLRHKNVCVTDEFSSRDMLNRIEKLIDMAVSTTSTTCDDLHFILDHKHDVGQNVSEHSLSIPSQYHESTIEYFDIMQKLTKQLERHEEPSSLQRMDWKKMVKNLVRLIGSPVPQHAKTLMQHKDMQVHKQLKIISQMLKGTLITEEAKSVKSLVHSSDEDSD